MLLLWFQSTISAPMLRKFIGCTSSWLVWDKNHNYFHAHTNVKARQLRIELRQLTLEGCTISDFLMEIQNLVDSAIGDPITIREHVDIIIEGLPENYKSSVSQSIIDLNLSLLMKLKLFFLVMRLGLTNSRSKLWFRSM